MFEAVPRRYDLINRLFTLGQDERWRARTARVCLRQRPGTGGALRVLDLGCGTGDLAIHLARQAPPGAEITGLDFSEPMLEVARDKAAAADLACRVRLIWGDARALPFPDGALDVVGIAFAFRNLTWRNPLRDRYLAEVVRVLRPGGRFVIVESSQPRLAEWRGLVHLYLRAVLPSLGALLAGQRGAYRYLAESACRFDPPDRVAAMLIGAGFRQASWRRLLGGVAALHVARK